MEVYTQPYNFSHHHIFTHPTTPRAQVLREAHELGQIDQWVVWRWGRPKDNGKRPKLPINPHTGDQADTTNPRTWASITQATTAVEKYDCAGIGFVFTRKDDFAGVDLDDCVENGEVAPWAMEIVEKLASYTELSPSGTGLKIWVKASKPGDRCKNKTGDIEIYDSGRFFTFTGERFAGDKVEERQDELSDLYQRIFPERPTMPLKGTPQSVRIDPRSSQSNLDDYNVLDKARNSQYGSKFEALFDFGTDGDHSKGDYELLKMLAFWCGKDAEQMERLFSQSALGQRDKWTRRKDYRQRTINKAIEATTKTYDPKYGKPKETTRESLQHRMEYALAEHQWGEKAGRASAAATDYFAYRAMLRTAYKVNRDTIAMSERELCEVAGLGARETASGSLRRLEDKHRLVVKVASGGKNGAATYRLKPVDSKLVQTLISKNTSKSTSIQQNCVYIENGLLLSQTLDLRNPAPDMPDYDKNGRRIPKGKQDPLNSLVKVCGWILDMVHALQTALPLSFLSERTGIRPNNLKKRYIIPMTVAGFIKETEDGYVATTNVEEALRDELEDSGCNERAKLQRERHDRERDAYSRRKNEKPDMAPTEEEMDAIREQRDSEDSDFEDFDGIELKPLLTPLVIACREYLERNPSRRNETPSWLAGTLWAYELYPGKPTRYEVAVALEELDVLRRIVEDEDAEMDELRAIIEAEDEETASE